MWSPFLAFLFIGVLTRVASGQGQNECLDHGDESCERHDWIPGETCCQDPYKMCAKMHAGVCKLKWQDSCKCDAILDHLCGDDCHCCVVCRNDTGSACGQTDNSICMAKCGAFHYEHNSTPCTCTDCTCCKPCVDNGCNTTYPGGCCVSGPEHCTNGYVFDPNPSLCPGESCGCCRPCTAHPACYNADGYPENKNMDCAPGYAPYVGGCVETECHCCLPGASIGCIRGDDMKGRDFVSLRRCFRHYKEYKGEGSSELCRRCYAGLWHPCNMTSSCKSDHGCCTTKSKCDCKDYYMETGGCDRSDGQKCNCCKHKCYTRYLK